jgi:predicted metal-dependent phosphotriesterase family hydrolase
MTANPMTEHVMTVEGPIAPDDLGFTLMHEHLLTRFWHATHRYDLAGMPEDDRYIIEELASLTETGCKSLVDVTPVGINRKPAALRDLARRTGIQVVMGCGWYRDHYYPASVEIDRRSVDSLADELVAEIEHRRRSGFIAPRHELRREPAFP